MNNFDDLFEQQPQPEATEKPEPQKEKPKKQWWQIREEKQRKEAYATLDRVFGAFSEGHGDMKAYLDTQSRFPFHSARNAILIGEQCPNAKRVGGYKEWASQGVEILEEEKRLPIIILEPGKAYRREDGSVGQNFYAKEVFDISQTRAAQRPAPATVRDERLLLKALMNNAPCRFAISNELPEGVNVTYHPQEHTVHVRQGLDAPTIFRGLAQELARAHMDRDGITCESPDFTAYSVSYMLCKRNGVSVEGFSFERLPESYAGMDARALRAEAGVMRDVAGSISADMNRLFAAQEKAQKNRDNAAR